MNGGAGVQFSARRSRCGGWCTGNVYAYAADAYASSAPVMVDAAAGLGRYRYIPRRTRGAQNLGLA